MPNVSKIEVDEIGGATGTTLTLTTGHVITGSPGQFQISGGTAGQALTTDGTGNLTFVDMTSDPTMGGDLTGTASNAQIAANAVGTVEIATDAVTSNEIVAGAVGTVEIATDAVTSNEIAAGAVGSSEIAAGAVGGTEIASTFDISSKTVTLPAASVTDHVVPYDDNTLKEEIALLGFRTAANGSLAKYNLVDQTIDAFEDASGIDASASTNEGWDSSGKYYAGEVSVGGNATGGTITTYTSGSTYKVHTLTNGQDFVAPSSGTINFLIVGGGGGGGNNGGGAGGGGVVYGTSQAIGAATYTAVVGAGGGAQTVGGDTTWNSFTAKGGGSGGAYSSTGGTGGNGGGGGYGNPTGGLGGTSNQDDYSGTTNVTGYGLDNDTYGGGGYNGGVGQENGAQGGAGAGEEVAWVPAAHRTSNYGWDTYKGGGDGGDGVSISITGTGVYYGGGGGGTRGNFGIDVGGAGGQGGGGAAFVASGNGDGVGGTNALGGGGGSAHYGTGGTGGTGTAIVSYVEDSFTTLGPGDLTLVSTTTTAQTAPTKGDIVFTYTNGAGTTTIGGGSPDVTAEYSADGGSTWTSMTLASEGSTGGHNIATAHDVALTSTSGTSMAYRIKTLNQSVSKTTRIQAVSLGWS